jgi:hypothetical protein
MFTSVVTMEALVTYVTADAPARMLHDWTGIILRRTSFTC